MVVAENSMVTEDFLLYNENFESDMGLHFRRRYR